MRSNNNRMVKSTSGSSAIVVNNPRMGSAVGNGEVSEFFVNTYPASYVHEMFIHNYLEHPEEMASIISILSTCQEEDTVKLYINSGGGALDSVDGLIYAIEHTKAHVHIIGSGTIASAATLLFFFADSYEISRNTIFMFHNASYGDYGNCQDMIEFGQFFYDKMVNFLNDVYGGFFNEDELTDIIVNKRQWYMGAPEFTERYSNMVKLENEKPSEMSDDFEGMIVLRLLDDKILNKLTKTNIIRYLKGEIEIDEQTGEIFKIDSKEVFEI